MTNLIALPTGTELVGEYRIQRVLGAGGFGVTYLADETALARLVTIKEYFPSDFAARTNGLDAAPRSSDSAGDFKWGLDRFIDEAKTLVKFNHPNIVRFYRYFKANGTAYMVLHFEEGQSFKSWLKGLGRAPRQKELDAIIAPLLDALELIHQGDFLHRDIAPDNIIIRKDGAPVLIDFGSARGEMAAHSKTVSALVKPGYSPYEQYAETSRQQGPWSDIYALAATLYHAITGKRPPDSPSRIMKDDYVSAREAAVGAYRAGFLKAIDKALLMPVEARPQSVAAWRGDLLAPDPARNGWLSRGRGAKRDAGELEMAGVPAAVPASGLVPPQPDAPGPQGGILDFFEALARPRSAQGQVAPQPPTAAPSPAPQAPCPAKSKAPAKAKPEPKPKPEPKAKSRVKPAPPAVANAEPPAKTAQKKPSADRAAPSRPRPVKAGDRRKRGSLWLKIAVAASLAGTVLVLQNRLPSIPGQANTAAAIAPQAIPVMIREIKAHAAEITGVAYSEDGRLVSASHDTLLKVWNPATGTLQRTVVLDSASVSTLAVRARSAVTGDTKGALALYDIDKGERIAQFKRNDAEVSSVTFLDGPELFAATSHDFLTAVWDARLPAAPQFTFDGHESAVLSAAFSQEGQWFATGSADRTVRLYNLQSRTLVRIYKNQNDFVTALAFSPDGKKLAIATLDGGIRLYSTGSPRRITEVYEHRTRIGALAFSRNGDVLVSAADEGTIVLWNSARGTSLRTLGGHPGGAKTLAFSPDGSKVASGGADGMIRIWSVPVIASGKKRG